MAKRETKVDRVARLTYEAVQDLRGEVKDIREEMVTKAALKSELNDMEDRLVGHFKDLKTDMKHVIVRISAMVNAEIAPS